VVITFSVLASRFCISRCSCFFVGCIGLPIIPLLQKQISCIQNYSITDDRPRTRKITLRFRLWASRLLSRVVSLLAAFQHFGDTSCFHCYCCSNPTSSHSRHVYIFDRELKLQNCDALQRHDICTKVHKYPSVDAKWAHVHTDGYDGTIILCSFVK
jgi:hypothetical protein